MCSHTKFINNNSFCDSIARQKWNMCRLSPAPCHLNHKYFVSATCMQKQRPWQPKMMNQGQSRKKLSTPITTFITDHMLNPECHWWRQIATKICKLEPRLKVAKLFCQWLGGDRDHTNKNKCLLSLSCHFSSSNWDSNIFILLRQWQPKMMNQGQFLAILKNICLK